MRALKLLVAGLMMFGGASLLAPDEADARGGGFRMSTRGFSSRPRIKGFTKPRTKTYRLGNQNITGYRNFIKARRQAKLASGGYRMRRDGKVVPRTWHIGTGRLSFQGRPLPRPAAGTAGTIYGQCRDGAKIEKANVDWACRNEGGVGWSQQSPRISGVRDY